MKDGITVVAETRAVLVYVGLGPVLGGSADTHLLVEERGSTALTACGLTLRGYGRLGPATFALVPSCVRCRQ